MISVDLFDQTATKIKQIDLHSEFLNGKIYAFLVTEVIRMYRASQRQGNACSQTRGEVSYSNAKPWKQKGTGRARAGSRKSPIWRGGGVAFGPKPRDYSFSMPKKMKRKALLSVLRSRFLEKKILLIDDWNLKSHKTVEIVALLKSLNVTGKTLLINEEKKENLLMATANIKHIHVKESLIVNALDAISCNRIICTEKAIFSLQSRLCSLEKVVS